MKRLLLALAFVAALCLCALPARADSPRGWERVQQDLGLTNDQMQKLKPIMEAYRQMRHGRIDALSAQIRGLLTPEQRARFDALKAGGGGRPHGVKEFVSTLSMSPDQIVKMQQLLRDSMTQARADYDRFLDQIRPILSADQLARFQEMTKRRPSE